MGAIFGIFDPEGPEPDWIDRMGAAMRHRGRGPQRTYGQGPIALGFRSRRETLTPAQPAIEGDFAGVLDGWIYEHDELARSAGEAPGATDTHSMVRAWRRFGAATPERLDGDFALAVWDGRDERLSLVRDPMGVRPLFLVRSGRRVAFASEPAALLALPFVSKRIDPDVLSEYLSFQVVHAPRTLLAGIEQLEPGHRLDIRADGQHDRSWWSPRYARPGTRPPATGELIEGLQEAVSQAVRRRLPERGGTGLYLSGGLGSTAIAVAARAQGSALPTFTVSLDDDPYPESPIAGRVAHLLGMPDHRDIRVGSGDVAERFDTAIQALPMPVGHPVTVLHDALARAAAASAPVALSGDGGDELFGGSVLDRWRTTLRLGQALARWPAPLRAGLARFLPGDAARAVARGSPHHWPIRLGLGGRNLFDAKERQALLRDPSLARPDVREAVLEPFVRDLVTDPVNTVLHVQLRSWLAEGALPLAERTAAACALDLRFPLLDRAVLRAAAAVPGTAKAGTLAMRWPLRALLRGTLPPALLDRPKRGLPSALGTWLGGEGRVFFEARFARLLKDRFGWYKPGELARLRRLARGRPDIGARLWTLIVLDTWLDGTFGPP